MEVSAPARWGVLVYSSASPDIESACRESFDEVIHAAPVDGVAVAGWLGTAAEIRQASPSGEVSAAPADMSRPQTLEQFLRWGMQAIPAERYVVVLGGHGSGFMGAVMNSARSRIMAPQEMQGALRQAGLRPDVLVLNACLEANVEVAAELASSTEVLVASQGLQHGAGIPLGTVIERLRADTTPLQAARLVVEAADGAPARAPVLSAIATKAVGAVVSSLDALGGALLEDAPAISAARELIHNQPDFRERPGDRPLVDLKDARAFARGLMCDPRLQASPVARAAQALDEAVASAVVAGTREAVGRGAEGLSVYLPTAPLPFDWVQAQYDRLRLSQQAPRWHAAVARIERPAAVREPDLEALRK